MIAGPVYGQNRGYSGPIENGGSSGGGGSKKLTSSAFLNYLEDWKEHQNPNYKKIQKLLNKEDYTTTAYKTPSVWVYYDPNGSKTVSRSDEIEIGAYIENTNPIEIRRALYLYLEEKGPGDKDFKPAKAERQIIQVNEYDEKINNTIRIFPDISSFGYIKGEGEVLFRIVISDGTKRISKWNSSNISDHPELGYYGVLKLKVHNNPPKINNSSMSIEPKLVKWDDYVEYRAQLKDEDRDTVNVTLHVYKNNTELNFTKLAPTEPDESDIVFSTEDYNIFVEADSGKNFTYRYSCDDDIDTTWSEIGYGPNLKRTAEITIVGKPKVSTTDPKNYWWQEYSFSIDAKSKNPEGGSLTVSLYTYTPENYGKMWPESQTKQVYNDNVTTFTFEDVKPFEALDSNQTFYYNFTYDMADESGDYGTPLFEGWKINPRLIKYGIIDPIMILNWLPMLIVPLLGGILIERLLRKGDEV